MPFLSFLVAVAYLPGVPSASLVGRWWVAAAGVSLLLWRAPATRVDRLALALLVWYAASLIWSESLLDTAGALLHLCAMAGAFYLASAEEDLSGVMTGFGLGVSVSAVLSVIQYFGVQPVLNISDHPVGLFLSKNGVVEAAFPVLAWALLARRWWLVPGAAVSVALSGSKEALLMAGAAGACSALILVRSRFPRIPPLALASIAAGVLIMGTCAVATWPESAVGTLDERLAIWQATLAAWWTLHPLLGFGFGTYPSLMPGIEYAHNDFLQLLFEVGPVGLALAAALLSGALASPGPLAERAALASLLAASLVWWPLYQPASAILVALLAGHLCGARGRRSVAERGGGGDRLAGVRHYGLPYRAAALRPAGAGASGLAAGAQPALGAAAVRN